MKLTTSSSVKGSVISSRRGIEKIICDFYSDLFDSHVLLAPHHPREDGNVISEVRKIPKQWKTSKTVLLYKKGDLHYIGSFGLLSVIYGITRVQDLDTGSVPST
ncbi:hypothetical protein RB195_010291 [Necator americanus]|uniref:Uncharacterized protein n=1 Tax=Necator americanus TaxID=51031 RepID=A0ABR1D0L8_NECAM